MAEEEVSEKISLHTLDDGEDRTSVKELTWREKLSKLMSTNKVQYTIIILVVLDSLIVVFELLIDMGIIEIPEDDVHEVSTNSSSLSGAHNHTDPHLLDPHNHSPHDAGALPPLHNHSHHLLNTAFTATLLNHSRNATGGSYPHLEEGEGGEGGHGEHGESGGAHDDPHHKPNKHLTEHVLHMASLTILTIFLVEVIFKILAEGKHLLKHKAEVFDAIVVIVSFTMDVTFSIVPVNQATKDYAGLLVLLRLWRVTRIINGVILSVKMDADKKLNAQKALRAKAEKQVQRLTDKLEKLTRENQKLRTRIALLESGGGGRGGAGGGGGNGDVGGGGGIEGRDSETAKQTVTNLDDNSQPHVETTGQMPRQTSAPTPLEELEQVVVGREWSGSSSVVTPDSHKSSSLSSESSKAMLSSTPLREKRLFGRESPIVVRSSSIATPPSCRGESGGGLGGSGSLLSPTESQQLLSFEEPVSENQELELRDPQVPLTQTMTGKLVPGVS